MEIINEETTNSGTYYTIKVVNKLIKVEKLLEIIDNFSDYQDKYGKFDTESLKEDILCPREYVVKVSDKITCTCKNSLFRKTPCRHITFIKNYILENGNKNNIPKGSWKR